MSGYMFEKGHKKQAIVYFIFMFILMIMLVCATVGCTEKKYKKEDISKTNLEPQLAFIILEEYEDYDIVYNVKTKVMYSVSDGVYNRGTFTPLLNADGTPMLYEETKK